jgi:integrase
MEGMCMRGQIYSYQKCPICGGKLEHNERNAALICPTHKDQAATALFRVRFGRDIHKRFKTFQEAERFLTGLRYEVDKGTFDPRDYQKDQPLGFTTLAEKWLSVKKQEVRPRSYANLKRYMFAAIGEWKQKNIKTIGFAEIEDFLYGQKVSDKTRSNIKSCLNTFWTWLRRRKTITAAQLPEFPEIKYQLGFRNIIDRQTQKAILDEVYRISFHKNPKIWFGIKWLSIYIAIRPGELLKMRERDIDVKSGLFFVLHTKEGKEKLVPMLDEDKELINLLPPGFPDLPYFRHVSGVSGVKAGQQFGEKYLYKWWKKACDNLGVEGVDLYGGTRHSTATALREFLSPEQIKAGTMHSTNKAFDRYLQMQTEDASRVYQKAQDTESGTRPVHQKRPAKIHKLSK